jgi:transcriptional regulator with XRE-family HTH domain
VAEDILRKNICSEIARLLKKERLRQKLSLNVVSARAGLNRQTVSFIEQEQRTPTIDTLLRLTAVLGIKLEDVIRQARKHAKTTQ